VSQGWLDLLGVDRIAAMREFLATWYPGAVPTGSPAPGVPAALAELYAIAAGRPEVRGTQNEILAVDRLRTDPAEGLLVFAGENQGNFWWMLDPAEGDPTVWRVPPHGEPVAEREPLSGFLVQFCLFEALMTGSALAGSPMVPLARADLVTASLREVPLAPWSWPGDPTRFFVAPDLVVYVGGDTDHVEIMAGARTPAALAPLTATGVSWDVFYDE
jgi:hypothetical protein